MNTMKPSLNSSSSDEEGEETGFSKTKGSPLKEELDQLEEEEAKLEGTMKIPSRSLRYEIDENLETTEGAPEETPVEETEEIQESNIEVNFEGEALVDIQVQEEEKAVEPEEAEVVNEA